MYNKCESRCRSEFEYRKRNTTNQDWCYWKKIL